MIITDLSDTRRAKALTDMLTLLQSMLYKLIVAHV